MLATAPSTAAPRRGVTRMVIFRSTPRRRAMVALMEFAGRDARLPRPDRVKVAGRLWELLDGDLLEALANPS